MNYKLLEDSCQCPQSVTPFTLLFGCGDPAPILRLCVKVSEAASDEIYFTLVLIQLWNSYQRHSIGETNQCESISQHRLFKCPRKQRDRTKQK